MIWVFGWELVPRTCPPLSSQRSPRSARSSSETAVGAGEGARRIEM